MSEIKEETQKLSMSEEMKLFREAHATEKVLSDVTQTEQKKESKKKTKVQKDNSANIKLLNAELSEYSTDDKKNISKFHYRIAKKKDDNEIVFNTRTTAVINNIEQLATASVMQEAVLKSMIAHVEAKDKNYFRVSVFKQELQTNAASKTDCVTRALRALAKRNLVTEHKIISDTKTSANRYFYTLNTRKAIKKSEAKS